jgi:crossover junction endodeoxyribonuclease RuvC
MIFLGLDPGTQRTGYAILKSEGSSLSVCELGVFDLIQGTSQRPELGIRLELLARSVRDLCARWNPDVIGLEKAIVFRNAASTITLAESRGVIRCVIYETLADAGQRLIEISPTRVKKAGSGSGRGSKTDVRKGLEVRFPGLKGWKDSSQLKADAFDALSIAWAAWLVRGRPSALQRSAQGRALGGLNNRT